MGDLHVGDGSPDDDILAGEYALGVLDAGLRRDVEARMRADIGFAERVAAWEARSTWKVLGRVDASMGIATTMTKMAISMRVLVRSWA